MKYYIYQHIRLDTNTIFYIGKGTKKSKGNIYHRAYTSSSRNNYWKNIVKLTNYKVEIIKEFNSEIECLKYETKLIKKYGYSWNNTGTLCNIVKDNKEIKLLARIGSSLKNSKKVYQYSLDGKFLKEFSSISLAKKEFKCDIYNAARQRTPTAGGYQWRLIKYDNIEKYIIKSKKVYQININNELIKIWNGTKEPSNMLNINRSAIRNCLIGLSQTAGGFKWKYNYE